MARCHREDAAEFSRLADYYEQRNRLIETGLVQVAAAAAAALALHAPALRRQALESEIRALSCEDVISVELREVALALGTTWAGSVDELLLVVDAVLSRPAPAGGAELGAVAARPASERAWTAGGDGHNPESRGSSERLGSDAERSHG